MIRKLLQNYKENGLYFKYLKKISNISIIIIVVTIITYMYYAIFWTEYFYICIFMFLPLSLLFVVFLILEIYIFFNALKTNQEWHFNIFHPIKSARDIIYYEDKKYIIEQLKENEIFNKEKIKIIIDSLNYYNPPLKQIQHKLDIGVITALVIFAFEADDVKQGIVRAILIFLAILYIKLIINDFMFFKEIYNIITNKEIDYDLLYEILNDILITEDFDTQKNNKSEDNCFITKFINNILNWFR